MSFSFETIRLSPAIRKLASTSAIYGIGGILSRFAYMLLLPFFTSTLTTNDYGALSLISLVTTACQGLLNLGTSNSISILFFSTSEHRNRSQVIWTAVLLLILNCILLLALFWCASSYLSIKVLGSADYERLIQLALVSLACSVIVDPFLSYMRMNNMAVLYVSMTLLSFGVTIGISSWLVLVREVGVIGVIIAQCCGQSFLLIISLFFVGRKLLLTFDLQLIRPLVSIGFPSVVGSFATLLLTYSDRWLLERFLGLDQLGIYSVGVSFGMFVTLLTGAFDTAWSPFFTSYINKREEAGQLFPRIFTYYVFGFGTLIVLIFSIAKPLVSLLLDLSFEGAWIVVGLIALSQVMYGAFSMLSTGLYFSRSLGQISYVKWIVVTINFVLNIVLIPLMGIFGAAAAMFIGYLILTIMTYMRSQREFRISYDWRRVSNFLFPFFVVVVLIWTSCFVFTFWMSTYLNLLVAFLFVLFVWFKVLTQYEYKYIVNYLKHLLRKA